MRSSVCSVRTRASRGAISARPSASAPTPRPSACAACAPPASITGFVALVDPAAGGRTLQALVGVTLAPGTDSDAFADDVARLEQVMEVLHLTGAPDYQLRVACRDTAELDALLRTLRLRHGAADTDTTIILRSGPSLAPPA